MDAQPASWASAYDRNVLAAVRVATRLRPKMQQATTNFRARGRGRDRQRSRGTCGDRARLCCERRRCLPRGDDNARLTTIHKPEE
jgi:hypothetical protein